MRGIIQTDSLETRLDQRGDIMTKRYMENNGQALVLGCSISRRQDLCAVRRERQKGATSKTGGIVLLVEIHDTVSLSVRHCA